MTSNDISFLSYLFLPLMPKGLLINRLHFRDHVAKPCTDQSSSCFLHLLKQQGGFCANNKNRKKVWEVGLNNIKMDLKTHEGF